MLRRLPSSPSPLARRDGRTEALLSNVKRRRPALAEHMNSVRELSIALARRMALPRLSVREIARAAELHDVGKLEIPDQIVDKPAPLERWELSLMRAHVPLGARLVAALPDGEGPAEIIRGSHERWDGSGYPHGLRAGTISLGARILSVCDAFDAMITDRPYRSALPVETAVEELQRGAGVQFDPAVVDAFAGLIESLGYRGAETTVERVAGRRRRTLPALRAPRLGARPALSFALLLSSMGGLAVAGEQVGSPPVRGGDSSGQSLRPQQVLASESGPTVQRSTFGTASAPSPAAADARGLPGRRGGQSNGVRGPAEQGSPARPGGSSPDSWSPGDGSPPWSGGQTDANGGGNGNGAGGGSNGNPSAGGGNPSAGGGNPSAGGGNGGGGSNPGGGPGNGHRGPGSH